MLLFCLYSIYKSRQASSNPIKRVIKRFTFKESVCHSKIRCFKLVLRNTGTFINSLTRRQLSQRAGKPAVNAWRQKGSFHVNIHIVFPRYRTCLFCLKFENEKTHCMTLFPFIEDSIVLCFGPEIDHNLFIICKINLSSKLNWSSYSAFFS